MSGSEKGIRVLLLFFSSIFPYCTQIHHSVSLFICIFKANMAYGCLPKYNRGWKNNNTSVYALEQTEALRKLEPVKKSILIGVF